MTVNIHLFYSNGNQFDHLKKNDIDTHRQMKHDANMNISL